MGIIVNNLSTAGASAANDIGNASGGTTGEKINSLLPSASTSGAGKVQLASTGEQNLSKVPRATGSEIASILTAGGYSLAPATGESNLDNIADGTSYRRVQAAKADAINAGRDLGLTRYSLVPLYRPLDLIVCMAKYLGNGVILVGTVSANKILRSTDYGRSWTNAANTSGRPYYFAQNGANIIVATNNSFGYYLSTDNGATWVGPIIQAGAGGTYAGGVWYLNGRWFISDGSTPRKLFYSDVAAPSLSTNWTEITTLTDCMSMVYFGTKLYAIKSGDGIYVSTDNGGTWAEVLNGSFANLVIAGSYLVALGETVYRTTDGTTWTNANSNVSLNAALFVTVLDTTIFARQNYKYIYFSTDYGTTWHNVGHERPLNALSYGYGLDSVNNITVLAASYDGVYKLVEVVK